MMKKINEDYSSWYKEVGIMKAAYQKELSRRKIRLLLSFIAAVSVYFIAAILKHV